MSALHTLSIHDAAALIKARSISSTELTRALIERIEDIDPTYRAFVHPTFAMALAAAANADAELAQGCNRGALHGVPIALKDAYDTAGVPATVCSRLFADRVPSHDAAAWKKLSAAGAILLGKLECTELCLGGPSTDGLVPHSRNPWDPGRYAGGSSSGAGVAIATGMVPGALGSDTGGSIRIPATFCGVAGIKPTYGLVSLTGLFPLSGSLDHAGPMARTSRDCAILLDAIAGHDPQDPASARTPPPNATAALSERLDGVRIGYVRAFAEAQGVTDESRAACEQVLDVLRSLGAALREVEMPNLWEFTVCNSTIMMAEAFAIHGDAFRECGHKVSAMTRARISLGGLIRAEDYIRAQKKRRDLARATANVMETCDVLIYPAALGDPPKTTDIKTFYFLQSPLITAPANVAGVPAASVRSGFSKAGMPMGFQVTGRLFGDATVLRVAHAYETATPEHSRIAGDSH